MILIRYKLKTFKSLYKNRSSNKMSKWSYKKYYEKIKLAHLWPERVQAKIYALSFLEGGQSVNSFRDFNPFAVYRSAGVGLRIFMPAFGLLGIDFGHAFDNLPDGTAPRRWETHFIIGQQF